MSLSSKTFLRGLVRPNPSLLFARCRFLTGSEHTRSVATRDFSLNRKNTGLPRISPILLAKTTAYHDFYLRISETCGLKFSTLSPSPSTNHQHDEPNVEEQASEKVRPPSALEKANLPLITPGHALSVLQIHGAGGKFLIRRSDFCNLCDSSRPGKKRDAKVIATALRNFKRINKFVLNPVGARAAIEGMMRSMTPNCSVIYAKKRLQTALFVAEQILDESTGLYFSVEIDLVDSILEEMHKAIFEMKERGVRVRIQNTEDEETNEEQDVDEKLIRDSGRAAQDIVKLLIKRRSRPESKMKKRAKRKYLKLLHVFDGPGTNTMTLATQISNAVVGPSATREEIFVPYTKAWWSSGIDASLVHLVEESEREESEEEPMETIDDSSADNLAEADADSESSSNETLTEDTKG